MDDIDNVAIEAAFATPVWAYLPSDFELWWKPGACEMLVGVRRMPPYPLTPIGELSDAAKAAIRAALKGEA